MPTKGQFTATVAVLFDAAPDVDRVADALARFTPVARAEALDEWAFGGPAVVLPFRPEVNGAVVADVVDRPWPDHMGDPKAEPALFAAWHMGNFGPATFPGGLTRAALQSWAWEDGKETALNHRAFVRVRASYVLGAGETAPLVPDDYEPLAELRYLTDVAAELMGLPGALCYFNPGGEAVRPAAFVTDALRYADAEDVPPLDVWANVRLFNLDDQWTLMDTVGHAQFEKPGLPGPFPDLEALLPPGKKYDPQEVDGFFRNIAIYLLEKGPTFRDCDTVDGPGDTTWKAFVRNHGLVMPPRPTLRFVPQDGSEPPPAAMADPDVPAG